MSTLDKPRTHARARLTRTLRDVTPSPWALTAVVMAMCCSWFVGYVLADAVAAEILGRY